MPRDHRPVWDIQDFAPSGASRLLERLLDVDGTETFEFEMHVDDGDWMKDSYVVRQGRNVEIGYITKRGGPQRAQHGVRYEVQDVDSSLPFSFGAWKPVSTSDDGSDWGGSHMWIRAQSTAIAKGIWFHKHWNGKFIAIAEWSGMTEEKRAEIDNWRAEHAEKLAEVRKKGEKDYDFVNNKYGDKFFMYHGLRKLQELRAACRNDCGVRDCELRCSKCKVCRYCSPKCQQEDWKYHKSVCGLIDGGLDIDPADDAKYGEAYEQYKNA